MNPQQAGNRTRQSRAADFWESNRPEIDRQYTNGNASQAEIAKLYGVSLAAFQNALKRMGISPKSKGRRGPLNGRYKDGSQTRIYRTMIEKKFCAHCSSTSNLLIHHRDGDHYNNVVENLMVLCNPCHTSLHKTEYWEKQKGSGAGRS